ncbi:MAG: SEC-C metal-binding domain-containing protein [Caldilineaceae bacterium]|nr:SEC-C metal-binding domain-containing protein [Caldilineaceae bacterium]
MNDFNVFMREHVNLNPSRYERLKRSDKAVSEYLLQNLVGFRRMERQGSYALGTTIRPVRDTDEYDVDRLVYMEYDSSKDPKGYIDDVYWCLKANGNYTDKVQRNTRCVTVNYAGEFKIDIVPCITVNGNHFICNRKTNKREDTDGTGFRDWFNDKNRITNGKLKLVTRLLKHLRDHKKTFTAPSILLTTLIGNAVRDWEDDAQFKTVPDALLTVILRIDEFLRSRPAMPEICNPALPGEDFTRHWDQDIYNRFRDMVASYARKIEDAYTDGDEKRSVRKWRDLFGDGFGNLSAMADVAATVAAPRVVKPSKPWATTSVQRVQGRLSLRQADLEWLAACFPNLCYDSDVGIIAGELELRAAYDGERGKLHIGSDDATMGMDSYLSDSFSIRINLDSLDQNGCPTVHEVDGRYVRIADWEDVATIDLHFFPDGACCLGLQLLSDRRTTLKEFMDEMVVPFFYRLSYTDVHGLGAAREFLWAEYSHGDLGVREYLSDIADIAGQGQGRNDPCPCGSGRKYKQCHLGEVGRFNRAQGASHAAPKH